MSHDLIVVGAGIAGLACARQARAAGLPALVLERSRGVGGRCATRRVEGQSVDHGLSFLHGSDPEFLAALERVDAAPLPGWPQRVRGSGAPCQPDAFAPGERRLAFADGVNAFPKDLAAGLDVRRESPVIALEPGPRQALVQLENGQRLAAPRVVLALPPAQILRFLLSLGAPGEEIAAVAHLLSLLPAHPCLTLLAGYTAQAPVPDWEIWYPEDSKILQVLSHDSSKRIAPRYQVLVLQAHPRWSRDHLEQDPALWSEAMLREAARLVGSWAGQPLWHQSHRWRHARLDRGDELSSPILLELPGGARLGLVGEVFAPGGGAQAAFLSGTRLARRLTGAGVPQ